MRFTVKYHGSPLGLRETFERFANEQWLPAYVTREEAAAIVLDRFKRAMAQALEVLEVRAEYDDNILRTRYEFVGGSENGKRLEVEGKHEVGATIRLPDPSGSKLGQFYELQDDGKFHFRTIDW